MTKSSETQEVRTLGAATIYGHAVKKVWIMGDELHWLEDQDVTKLVRHIKGNTGLEEVSLPWNKIGDPGATALTQLLAESNLQRLNLTSNKIGDEGARAIGEALKANPNLSSLSLYNNNLTWRGVAAISEALAVNTHLTSLNLSRNKVGYEGADRLANALEKNTSIKSLDFSGNNAGDQGIERLVQALEDNTSITYLGLASNKIGARGAKALARLLKKKNYLRVLDLDNNEIGDEGAEALLEAIKNSDLTNMFYVYNDVSQEVRDNIYDALTSNQAKLCAEFGFQGVVMPDDFFKVIPELRIMKEKWQITNDQIRAAFNSEESWINPIQSIKDFLGDHTHNGLSMNCGAEYAQTHKLLGHFGHENIVEAG